MDKVSRLTLKIIQERMENIVHFRRLRLKFILEFSDISSSE